MHRDRTPAVPATWLRLMGMFALFCLPSRARADGIESAHAAYQAGQAAQESRMRRALFTRGMDLARARLANQANDPEGLYWLAVNMGAEALERGKLSALPVVPRMEQLLPLADDKLGGANGNWDYIYEPDAKPVIDELLVRYIESLVYQAVVENMASEQSSRMVAMKAASDNAKSVIGELKLVYNKARQAAITKEISEIVGGAAAV